MHPRKPQLLDPPQPEFFADAGQFAAVVGAAAPERLVHAPEKLSSVANSSMRAPGFITRLISARPRRTSGMCSST